MNERIHDDEPDTGESVVRELLRVECPAWATSQLEYLRSSGTDNAMWRVRVDGQSDLVVRLPRRSGSAAGVLAETAVLERLEQASISSTVLTPRVRHVGDPHEVFPHHWSVLEWIDGDDAWARRHDLARRSLHALAHELADAICAIRAVDTDGVRRREPGSRGGPLGPLLDRLDAWLSEAASDASHLVDVRAVRRFAAEAAELVDEPVDETFVHGDLIAGNLLVSGDRLAAILDWGGAGLGDSAQDLAPAWS
ncbi:MAG: phosphotransferase, partial [Actinomycetota bacterium]